MKVRLSLKYNRKTKIKLLFAFTLLIWYYFLLPDKLFNDPHSTVVTSKEGYLLGAKIAKDGQWRFPESDSIPDKFSTCIVQFEDAYFYKHIGFNPVSMGKALIQNVKANKIIRGGSTLTQQTIRLSRKNRKRTYFEKFKELLLATRLEFRYSKEEILNLYASNAPFGGNVVGLEAASWRYFGRTSYELSWAESATLAVLPNAPSLIFPGKNQELLLNKRNRLLKKLYENKIIDTLTYELSMQENLPQKPFAIPQTTPHLLNKIVKDYEGKRVKTSIPYQLQTDVNAIVAQHYDQLKQNEIFNIAVVVFDVNSKKVLSYVGNSPTNVEHQKDVDIIDKPRSTGSILKPFLYVSMLDDGQLLPEMLVPDIPMHIAGYSPQNFDKKFSGAIPANLALSRSLNVPAVRMLQDFGLEKFHDHLQSLNLKDLKFGAGHYGLSIILGGAESNLWDLTRSYASLGSIVNNYYETQGRYVEGEFEEPSYLENSDLGNMKLLKQKGLFNAGAIYMALEAMNEVNRPESERNWDYYESAAKVAWKTGTSFGFRDAWSIGLTKNYAVGVWVGNADGEGRPGLVGIKTAAPIMFDVFEKLPQSSWFDIPYDELSEVEICNTSGYRKGSFCDDSNVKMIQKSGLKAKPCPFHKLVHLDQQEEFQVNTSCEPLSEIIHKIWFELPPIMEYYFEKKNPFYRPLPDFRLDCISDSNKIMEFENPSEITVFQKGKDFGGDEKGIIIKVIHKDPKSKLFWYSNRNYLGSTEQFHEFDFNPEEGHYLITVIDEKGNEIKRNIEIKP